jgi:hypothetical protein
LGTEAVLGARFGCGSLTGGALEVGRTSSNTKSGNLVFPGTQENTTSRCGRATKIVSTTNENESGGEQQTTASKKRYRLVM